MLDTLTTTEPDIRATAPNAEPPGVKAGHDPDNEKKWVILERRRKIKALLGPAGFKTLKELAEFAGGNGQWLEGLIAGSQVSLKGDGSWSEFSAKIAEALLTTPEDIFGLPEDVQGRLSAVGYLLTNSADTVPDMAAGFISVLPTPADKEREMTEDRVRKNMEPIIKSLEASARELLELRYGLGGGARHTQEEISEQRGVTHQAISDTESKILRRLRSQNSERKRWLRSMLDDLTQR